MKDTRAILFDWDGTLLDSFPATYNASMAVLRHFGIDVDRERFLETYSPNWYDSYERLGIARTEWDRADRLWRETYKNERSHPFPFAEALLDRLRGAGYTLGIVTSGDRERVSRELAAFAFREFFSVVVCFEDTVDKKPHPAPLSHALQKLALPAPQTIYVGDRPEDVEMGQRAGAYTVGVVSEYGPRAVLEEASPDQLLPDASHLPRALGLD